MAAGVGGGTADDGPAVPYTMYDDDDDDGETLDRKKLKDVSFGSWGGGRGGKPSNRNGTGPWAHRWPFTSACQSCNGRF